MCTVTYLPISSTEFILTSNRDERVNRAIALQPKQYRITDKNIYFPKDAEAGGTWIAASENNYTLCLLNGGFQKHLHQPPYRISRGIMLLDFFKYNDAVLFSKSYNFIGIEPFTLLIICTTNTLCFYKLVWDGKNVFLQHVDEDKPHIFSSATLYNKETIAARQFWFNDFLSKQNFSQEAILHFHQFAGDGNAEHNVLMNKNNVLKTVSITTVHRSTSNLMMHYLDTQSNTETSLRVIK
jgi:hypothetical protein